MGSEMCIRDSLMNMFTEDAAKQLKIAIENEVFYNNFVTEGPASANEGATAGAISAAYNLGTDTTPVDQSSAANVLNAILRMSSVLDEQNVPEDGRFLVISPYDRHLLMQSNIAQAYFTGDSSSIVRTGRSACWTVSLSTSATCCRVVKLVRLWFRLCPQPLPVLLYPTLRLVA